MLFQFGDHALDPERRELHRGLELIPVEPQVFDLLVHLIRNRDRVISKDELIETVWGGRIVSEATIDSRVKAARQVVGDSGVAQRIIRTSPRKGVRFIADVREQAGPVESGRASGGHETAALPLPDKPSLAMAQAATPSPPDRRTENAPDFTMVVLPFANLGGNPNENYLAEAITEDLTTDLSCLPGAFVIARQSAEAYKGKSVNVRKIGEELSVRFVVEGSVRKLGDVLRVTARLISTESNAQIWAGRFDQNAQDIGVGQEEIVSRLRAVLGIQMVDAESVRSMRERPDHPNASDLILRGVSALRKAADPLQLGRAAELLEQALLLDAQSVRAMCALATGLIDRYVVPEYSDRGNEALLERAASLVSAAVAIEPDSARVLFAQAALQRARGRWAEALASLSASR
jgi:TolB-like protein